MTSKEEKKRRREIVKRIAAQETGEAIKNMPISLVDLGDLFDCLDKKLVSDGCDHTKTITKSFLANKGLEVDKILFWLEEYGGGCDCEILANVEDTWSDEIEKVRRV